MIGSVKPPKGWKINTIVVHKDCVDGFLSEVILRDVYPDADVLRLRHEMPEYENLEPHLGMLFCDIAPPAARAGAFFSAGAVVFDHHRTAAAIFDRPGCTRRSRFSQEYGASGAVLAFQHWCVVNEVKAQTDFGVGSVDARLVCDVTPLMDVARKLGSIARFVGIYDTWCDTHVDFGTSRAVHAVLDVLMRTRPQITVMPLVQDWHRLYLPMGGLLVDEVAARAREIASRAEIEDWDTVRVALLPLARHDDAIVQAATEIAGNVDVVISGVPDVSKVKGSLSLRSRGNGIDCSKLAVRLGGGGHRGAAGCPEATRAEIQAAIRKAIHGEPDDKKQEPPR